MNFLPVFISTKILLLICSVQNWDICCTIHRVFISLTVSLVCELIYKYKHTKTKNTNEESTESGTRSKIEEVSTKSGQLGVQVTSCSKTSLSLNSATQTSKIADDSMKASNKVGDGNQKTFEAEMVFHITRYSVLVRKSTKVSIQFVPEKYLGGFLEYCFCPNTLCRNSKNPIYNFNLIMIWYRIASKICK